MLEVFSGALTAVSEHGAHLVTQAVTQSNHPFDIVWSWLDKLDSNSLILAPAPWFMLCLLELSQRGSRIALLSSSGFWPTMFSRYICDWQLFTSRDEESSRYLTEYLLASGYKQIAFAGSQSYLNEPYFPFTGGYEQAIQGHCQRQVIEIESAERTRESLMQAYQESAFDALVICPNLSFSLDYSRSLAANLGLPEEVCIVSTLDYNVFCRLQPQISAMKYPYHQMGYDATVALLDENFQPGVRYYEGSFQPRGVLAVEEKPEVQEQLAWPPAAIGGL